MNKDPVNLDESTSVVSKLKVIGPLLPVRGELPEHWLRGGMTGNEGIAAQDPGTMNALARLRA